MPKERKHFRTSMGFSSETKTKMYLKFTDEIPLDWKRLKACNTRVKEIFAKLNPNITPEIQVDLDEFNKKIDDVYKELKRNKLFQKLTNNGRNPVDVYYSWLRGYAVCEFFLKAISIVFDVPLENIKRIGKDNFTDVNIFQRKADADLEVIINDSLKYKIEVQSGFTGVNDIKKTKIDKAIYVKENENIDSYLIHFDIFNGQVALCLTSEMNVSDDYWKIKFENSKTIPISPNAFKWNLEDKPLKYAELEYKEDATD